jgi:hypothetical protein
LGIRPGWKFLWRVIKKNEEKFGEEEFTLSTSGGNFCGGLLKKMKKNLVRRNSPSQLQVEFLWRVVLQNIGITFATEYLEDWIRKSPSLKNKFGI